jgi:hypothetical protein
MSHAGFALHVVFGFAQIYLRYHSAVLRTLCILWYAANSRLAYRFLESQVCENAFDQRKFVRSLNSTAAIKLLDCTSVAPVIEVKSTRPELTPVQL